MQLSLCGGIQVVQVFVQLHGLYTTTRQQLHDANCHTTPAVRTSMGLLVWLCLLFTLAYRLMLPCGGVHAVYVQLYGVYTTTRQPLHDANCP
jgi:hypothetical protein